MNRRTFLAAAGAAIVGAYLAYVVVRIATA